VLVILFESLKIEGDTLNKVLQSAKKGIDFFQLKEEIEDEL